MQVSSAVSVGQPPETGQDPVAAGAAAGVASTAAAAAATADTSATLARHARPISRACLTVHPSRSPGLTEPPRPPRRVRARGDERGYTLLETSPFVKVLAAVNRTAAIAAVAAREQHTARLAAGRVPMSDGSEGVSRSDHGIVSTGGPCTGPFPACAFAIAAAPSAGVMNPAATSAFTAAVYFAT